MSVSVGGSPALLPFKLPFLSLEPCSSRRRNAGIGREQRTQRLNISPAKVMQLQCTCKMNMLKYAQIASATAYASVVQPKKVCSNSCNVNLGFFRFQTCPSKSGNVGMLQESSNSNTSTFGQRKHRITHSQCFPSSDVLKPKPFQVDLP